MNKNTRTHARNTWSAKTKTKNILPYRLIKNNSQKSSKKQQQYQQQVNDNDSKRTKKKTSPLWYNFNFFYQVPEYHRIGNNELYVGFELQIGLRSEINFYRSNNNHATAKKKPNTSSKMTTMYDPYTKERILSDQPLLKNYLSKIESGSDTKDNIVSNQY